ncbi:MAG: hypothetical protein ACYDAG_08920, partial [Chloroflexota bacterium]
IGFDVKHGRNGRPMARVGWRWEGRERPRRLHYSMFVHVVDAHGRKVGQDDRALPLSSDWDRGERVVQWFPLPAFRQRDGRFWLHVGMYAMRGVVRQRLSGTLVHASGRFVRLGPFGPGSAATSPSLGLR